MNKENLKKYVFIGKTLFFPRENILTIGDLHLGYEEALRKGGLDIPIKQFAEIITELGRTLDYTKARYGKIGEMHVVFLGDIKHGFGFVASEKEGIKKLISFLHKKGVKENKIIFIRGNHEKNDKSGKFWDFYIEKDIAFAHGHREFIEIYAKEINLIVMGHLHPTITIKDKIDIRHEKYKCFLAGKWKKKEIIILPSFMSATEGVSLTEFTDKKGFDLSIVPQEELDNFEVFVCSDIGSDALSFGKLGKMKGK